MDMNFLSVSPVAGEGERMKVIERQKKVKLITREKTNELF